MIADLSELALPGATFAVRVTPRARSQGVEPGPSPGDPIRIRVHAPPVDGEATRAARDLLAQALGVAPSRLLLRRGAASRDKLFQLE